jgi:hypothetical protein
MERDDFITLLAEHSSLAAYDDDADADALANLDAQADYLASGVG